MNNRSVGPKNIDSKLLPQMVQSDATQLTKSSVPLPQAQHKFIGTAREYSYKTQPAVVNKVLRLLQQTHLERYYQEANQEINNDFEITASDGL